MKAIDAIEFSEEDITKIGIILITIVALIHTNSLGFWIALISVLSLIGLLVKDEIKNILK